MVQMIRISHQISGVVENRPTEEEEREISENKKVTQRKMSK
jgi:hypothetical protein